MGTIWAKPFILLSAVRESFVTTLLKPYACVASSA
jgi:hypothetical protein